MVCFIRMDPQWVGIPGNYDGRMANAGPHFDRSRPAGLVWDLLVWGVLVRLLPLNWLGC